MYVLATRHGQTNWNAENRIQGQKDIELNDTGREQADIINQALNIPIIEDARLMERSFGNSEGLTKAEIRELEVEHPEITDIWNYKRNVGYNGIEPFQEFAKRIYEFLDEIIKKYHEKRILIVSHGGVLVPMYIYFNKIPLETMTDLSETPKLKNGEFLRFEIK